MRMQEADEDRDHRSEAGLVIRGVSAKSLLCSIVLTLCAGCGGPSAPQSRLGEPAWKVHFDAVQDHKHPSDLVFVGDSIFDQFSISKPFQGVSYRDVWNYYYADRGALNFGFAGDSTANVLWRIQHSEMDGISPRLVVLLIGTNNTGKSKWYWSRDADVDAIEEVVRELHDHMPSATILVVGILPNGQSSWKTAKDDYINQKLAERFGHGEVRYADYVDVTSAFLKHGILDTSLFSESYKMPSSGAIHPTPIGQMVLSETLEPRIAKLLGDRPKKAMRSRH